MKHKQFGKCFSDGSCWEIIIIKQIHKFTSSMFFGNDVSVWVAPAFIKSNGKKRRKTNQFIATFLFFQNKLEDLCGKAGCECQTKVLSGGVNAHG